MRTSFPALYKLDGDQCDNILLPDLEENEKSLDNYYWLKATRDFSALPWAYGFRGSGENNSLQKEKSFFLPLVELLWTNQENLFQIGGWYENGKSSSFLCSFQELTETPSSSSAQHLFSDNKTPHQQKKFLKAVFFKNHKMLSFYLKGVNRIHFPWNCKRLHNKCIVSWITFENKPQTNQQRYAHQ